MERNYGVVSEVKLQRIFFICDTCQKTQFTSIRSDKKKAVTCKYCGKQIELVGGD